MREDKMVAVAAAPAGADSMAAATGVPRHNRRLGDKVLAAFNHAYAVGALDVAAQLREILARLEAERNTDGRERRDSVTTLAQADLWMAFVEARNDYQAVSESDAQDSSAAAEALQIMKSAYAAWSAG